MSSIDPKILGKIRKCLALSASSNENEAATALRQAQKLMEYYGVSHEALVGAEISEGRAKSTACTKPAGWEHRLSHLLARAFACEVIVHTGWFNKATNSNGALAEFVYIGLKHQSRTASYAHDVLRRQIVKARAAYLDRLKRDLDSDLRLADKIASGDAFCIGFVNNIAKQIHDVGGLLESHKVAIANRKRFLLGGDGVTISAQKRGFDENAYAAGSEAGRSAQLNRGVDNNERLKLR